MIFTETSALGRPEFLASAKFKAIAHTFTEDAAAGTAVAITDGLGNTQYGIVLNDVAYEENPNGAVVVDGIVRVSKLPEAPSAAAAAAMFPTLIFVD